MFAPWRSDNPVRITKSHVTGKSFITLHPSLVKWVWAACDSNTFLKKRHKKLTCCRVSLPRLAFFFFFSPTLIFLSFFSQCGSWSQATSYIALNTNSCTLTDCTFALGGISIPCSLFTSHFSLAFKCEPSVTRVLNCLSVLVVITNFKAMIYITRGSTVSFNLNRKKNLNNRKTRVNEWFISLSSNFRIN